MSAVVVGLLLIVAALTFIPAGLLILAAVAIGRHKPPRVPAGHALGASYRIRSRSLAAFAADCACGITCYGATLPSVWGRHEHHLAEVKAASMRSHPAGGAA